MILYGLLACFDVPTVRREQCALATTKHVATDDGAEIVLHHHACTGGPAVLLVHGISSNDLFWDLDPEHSLAAWLGARGYDVWSVDLRGHGEALYREDGRRQWSGWTVDDYGQHDIPAAVDHVRRLTGRDKVAYVGHSMGGMVGAIYLASGGDDAISSFIAVGSPITFSKSDPLIGLARAGFGAGGSMLVWFETPMFAAAAADLDDAVPFRLQEKLYNPANFTPATIDRMLRSIVSPTFREEMQQFAGMLRDERFQSYDGSIDWYAKLHDVKTPVLAIAGMADEVATPAHVRAWREAMGGEVEVFEAGTVSGLVADYGHLDLGLGERAGIEIFPQIERWLKAHP